MTTEHTLGDGIVPGPDATSPHRQAADQLAQAGYKATVDDGRYVLVPSTAAAELLTDLAAARAEVDRLTELTASCTCDTGPFSTGPEADCPVHGAIRGFNEAQREIRRLREREQDLLEQAGMAEGIFREVEAERDAARAEAEQLRGILCRVCPDQAHGGDGGPCPGCRWTDPDYILAVPAVGDDTEGQG